MPDRKVLIIEDDPGLASQMRWCLDGFEVTTVGDAREAEAALRRLEPQVITLDLGLPPDPGGTRIGFQLLQTIGRLLPASKVLVVTGREDREFALRAVAEGAYDFYQKPIDSATLTFAVERAFRVWELEDENRRLAAGVGSREALPGLVTANARMLELVGQLQRVGPTDASVLISGETGTGKELFAQGLHRLSRRADGPFVAINCAAIPENLLESELFGHEKGAFTGAVARKIGRIEAAHGGTLFLDEIGDMPLALQAKILRFLQERVVARVGGTTDYPVDVRVVSATHQDLDAMVSEQRFRQDLYFRLAEIVLPLPALRERGDDVILLARTLLKRFSDGQPRQFSPEAERALGAWHWPGNIRELENRVRRASILAEGRVLTPVDLELVTAAPPESMPLNLRTVRARAEREAILGALHRTGNNISETARLLGVSRPTLYGLLIKYDLNTDKEP